MGAKDITAKQLMEYADVFADILNGCLFGGKQLVLPSDLNPAGKESSYKDKEQRSRAQERDVAKFFDKFSIRFAFFGIENQETAPENMPLRVIGYDGAVYRDEINDKAEAEAEIKEHKKKGEPFDENDKRLQTYPAITVVLYFNPKKKWDAPKTLKECFKNVPKEIEPYVNDYKIHVIDVAWLPDEVVAGFKSDFRLVAEYYGCVRKKQQWQEMPQKVKHWRDLMNFFHVVTEDDLFIELYKIVETEGLEDKPMDSIVFSYFKESADKAIREEGFRDGRKDGERNAIVMSIKNVMQNLHLTSTEAMDALNIPATDRQTYLTLI